MSDKDGVQDVGVDDVAGEASIGYDPAKTDLEALRQGVRNAGYDVLPSP